MTRMKKTSLLFLAALQMAAAAGAEERLIPFDSFSIYVPVTDESNSRGLKVKVQVDRNRVVPQGFTDIEVSCPALHSDFRTLEPEEREAFMNACTAALNGQEYREEIQRKSLKTVFEVVTVNGYKRVRIGRGGEVFLIPEEGARLKEALVQAAVAEAWYKMLLTAHALPEKTAEAHPPKADGYRLQASLGSVHGEGLDYQVSLQREGYTKRKPYRVEYSVHNASQRGNQRINEITDGEWVKRMMEQVVLALEAVGRKEAFAVEAAARKEPFMVALLGGRSRKFTVTANLTTQKADVSYDSIGYEGNQPPKQYSFAVSQLAEIRAVAAQEGAQAKWFAEHEGWFFERE